MKSQIHKLFLLFIMFIMVASACSKSNTHYKNNTALRVSSDTACLHNSQLKAESKQLSNELNPITVSSANNNVTKTLSVNTLSKATYTLCDMNSVKATDSTPSKGIVAIDAGHQKKGNYALEPIGPGAKTKKPKVSSGTQGAYTGVPEYKLNLAIAKKVKKELISRGYQVVMIRNTNNINLSNKERAVIANKSDADIFIRIHADGSNNSSVNGASTLYPSKHNPYVSQLHDSSYSLSKAIVNAICKNTGAKNRGAIARDDMSGINWCKIPVTIIEMGYMTNKKEDKLMQTGDYQDKIVQGICDGIDKYFE